MTDAFLCFRPSIKTLAENNDELTTLFGSSAPFRLLAPNSYKSTTKSVLNISTTPCIANLLAVADALLIVRSTTIFEFATLHFDITYIGDGVEVYFQYVHMHIGAIEINGIENADIIMHQIDYIANMYRCTKISLFTTNYELYKKYNYSKQDTNTMVKEFVYELDEEIDWDTKFTSFADLKK